MVVCFGHFVGHCADVICLSGTLGGACSSSAHVHGGMFKTLGWTLHKLNLAVRYPGRSVHLYGLCASASIWPRSAPCAVREVPTPTLEGVFRARYFDPVWAHLVRHGAEGTFRATISHTRGRPFLGNRRQNAVYRGYRTRGRNRIAT